MGRSVSILIALVISSAILADGPDINQLKAIAEKIIKAQDSDPPRLTVMEEINYDEILPPPCPSCPNILMLTESVNGILDKVAEDNPEPVEDHLPERIKSLKAMYFITKAETRMEDGTAHCFRTALTRQDEDWSADLSEAAMIFSETIDLSSIQAVHLNRSDGSKTYIYRGKLDQENIVVIVDTLDDKKARVRYYKVFNAFATKVKPTGDAPIKGEWKQFTDTDHDTGEFFKMAYGFGIKERRGLPSELLILDIESANNFLPGTKITTDIKVTSQTAQAKVALKSSDSNREIVYLAADKDRIAALGIPFALNINSGQFKMQGEAAVAVNSASLRYIYTLPLLPQNELSANLQYAGTGLEVRHKSKLTQVIDFSVLYSNKEVQDGRDRDNRLWIMFEGKFE